MFLHCIFEESPPPQTVTPHMHAKANMLSVTINGAKTKVLPGTLIKSIRAAGVPVPSMCYHPDLASSGGRCRVCVCEVDGRMITPCNAETREGMTIVTESQEVLRLRKAAQDMISSTVQQAEGGYPVTRVQLGKEEQPFDLIPDTIPIQTSSRYIVRRPELCINCNLCVLMCNEVQGVSAIANVRSEGTDDRGVENNIRTFHSVRLPDTECISCGQCINVCPTGALAEASEIEAVENALRDSTLVKVIQFAPAVRVALAEEFGFAPGERSLTLEMVAATRKLGETVCRAPPKDHIKIFDTNFTADLTIMEEGFELLERLRRALTGKKKFGGDHFECALPMITSCSPGWVNHCERHYPDLLANLSTCKSPMEMAGALAKHIYPTMYPEVQATDVRGRGICSVAIMPCVAKKYEKDRPEFSDTHRDHHGIYGDRVAGEHPPGGGEHPPGGGPPSCRKHQTNNGTLPPPAKDVDHVLTTREFAKLLKLHNIDPTKLPKEQFDDPFGLASGAGLIFGATGGVMEAALRTAYEVVTGRSVPYDRLRVTPVRGMEGVKEACILIEHCTEDWAFLEGVELKVAVAHGIRNAEKLMERVRQCKQHGDPIPYHFIEIMACPGGCLGGGGQPKPTSMEIKTQRARLIYDEDMQLPLRKSHENPAVQKLYADVLKEPLGELSHHLLHTSYHPVPVESHALMKSPEAQAVKELLLKDGRFPPNSRRFITNLLVDVVDAFGYVSDAAIVAVAEHVGTSPIEIESLLSHYHFFNREEKEIPRKVVHQPHKEDTSSIDKSKVGGGCPIGAASSDADMKSADKTMVFLCDCSSCRAHGSREVRMELLRRGTPFHLTPWLGWCVNHAPAAIVRHAGDAQLHPLFGIKPRGDERLVKLNEYRFNPQGSLVDNIETRTMHRFAKQAPPGGVVSVLRNIPLSPEDQTFLSQSGQCPVSRKALLMGPERIIETLKAATIRGCGGAGFPTHIKWRSVRGQDESSVGPKYIVVNADEGLPNTFKDLYLLHEPHTRMRMVSGVCIAAHTVGAKEVYVYLRYEYRNLKERILESFEMYRTKLNPAFPKEITFAVVLGGGPYICGEETALFESIEGHLPQARATRTIYPTSHGLFGQPTLVGNVETFAWVPPILYNGGDDFATPHAFLTEKSASPQSKGVKLFSISGHVPRPVLAEFPLGVSLRFILEEASGVPMEDIAAVEVGGMLEQLTSPSDFDLPVTLDGAPGTLPAGGSIVVFSKERLDMKQIYGAKAKFTNTESCQLCTPCREGSKIFRNRIDDILDNKLTLEDKIHLQEVFHSMEVASNCGHGKGSGKLARMLLDQSRVAAGHD